MYAVIRHSVIAAKHLHAAEAWIDDGLQYQNTKNIVGISVLISPVVQKLFSG